MSALFGEIITCGQGVGTEIQLRIFGDEYYARYESVDGYSVVYDKNFGCYCYAQLAAGRFVSSGVPIGKSLPNNLRKHLKEEPSLRNKKFAGNFSRLRPREIEPDTSATFTLGSDDGLLSGRKLHQGEVRGLTIIVDFADISTNITSQAVDEMFNGENYQANGNYCSINQYFKIVSSGKLNYINTVVGPIQLSKKRSFYIGNLLVEEALDIAINEFGIDLADYDSRDEGIVDAINFLYAGDSQYSGELWPHNSVARLQRGAMRTHYYQLTGLGIQEVDLRIGTICHENGHLLCRFPDMYDYGERDGDFEKSQGIGRYCLMGSGNHLNGRRTPSPVCGFLRELAGWVDHVIPLEAPAKISAEHASYNTIYKHQTDLANEYFVVENRSQLGLDTHLPSSGLAIYHCDTLGSNEWQEGSRNRHYQCALLQADGSLDLENNRNAGDSTDLFSEINQIALSDTTSPSSRMWNGTDSGLLLSEVGEAGQNIAFTVGRPQDRPLVEVDTSPNLLIPDDKTTGVSSHLKIDSQGEIESISVVVDIIHSWIGDLKVVLVNPEGIELILHDKEGANGDDINATYTSAASSKLVSLVGSEVQGEWRLMVVDTASGDIGRLVHWGISARYQRRHQLVEKSAIVHLQIPDEDVAGISSDIDIQETGKIKDVLVSIDIEHTYIGDLRVEIISPSGKVVRLHDHTGASHQDIKRSYDVASTPELITFQGDSAQGHWQLKVIDSVAQDTGKLIGWSVSLEL